MQFYCEDYRSVLDLLEEGSYRADPYAVRRACAEFKRLVLHHNAVRHAMVQQGRLLPALVEIVSDHVQHDHGAVLADWCHFCSALSRTNVQKNRPSGGVSLRTDTVVVGFTEPTELDIQSKITEAGCLGLMVKGLATHPRAQRLYAEVCRLIALLCFDTVAAPHGAISDLAKLAWD